MFLKNIPKKFILRFFIAATGCLCLYFSPLSNAQEQPVCKPENITVALDAGHSPASPGAVSARGKPEYEFNQNLTRKLHQRLQAEGFKNVFAVNQYDEEIALWARPALANSKNTDLFISIHHDSVQEHYLAKWKYDGEEHPYSDRFNGYSLFFSGKSNVAEESQAFATLLGKQLRRKGFVPTPHHAEAIKGENRPLLDAENGIYQYDDLMVLKKTRMPAVLLECGVILNRDEEILLNNPVYQEVLVETISDTIKHYAKEWVKKQPGCAAKVLAQERVTTND